MIEDPFGLGARRGRPRTPGGALLVYPRLVALDRLFSESGAHAQDGRRLLLRRPSGFDLHSVREYEQGESLRKVHWRTTARRGQLMVKELEDAPRDEIAVAPRRGRERGQRRTSFDVQVRAAGSILRAHARHGRRARARGQLARRGRASRVSSLDGDWLAALGLLAAARAGRDAPVVELAGARGRPGVAGARDRGRDRAALGRARDTARAARARSAGRQRRLDRRRRASRAVRRRVEPELLRLQAAGVAVAVVRQRRLARRGARRGARG